MITTSKVQFDHSIKSQIITASKTWKKITSPKIKISKDDNKSIKLHVRSYQNYLRCFSFDEVVHFNHFWLLAKWSTTIFRSNLWLSTKWSIPDNWLLKASKLASNWIFRIAFERAKSVRSFVRLRTLQRRILLGTAKRNVRRRTRWTGKTGDLTS